MTEPVAVRKSLGDRWRELSLDAKLAWAIGILLFVLVAYKVVMAVTAQQPHNAAQDEALVWEKYLRKNPKDPAGYVGLGAAMEMLGKPSAAEADYKKALKLSPKNLAALYSLGRLYELEHKFNKALPLLLEVGKDSSPGQRYIAYYDAGTIYQAEKKYQKAIKLYREALASNGTMVDIHLSLAECYQATGDPALALEEYQIALQFDPKNPNIPKRISELKRLLKSKGR